MRLGTRGSVLALAQARLVAALLDDAELVTITVSGDRDSTQGEKSRWVDAIEDALRAGEIDLAVHSAKDMPAELADGLALLGAPARAGAEDVICLRADRHTSKADTNAHRPNADRPNADRPRANADAARTDTADARTVFDDDAAAAAAAAANQPKGVDALPPGARLGSSSLRRAAQLRAAREDLEIVPTSGNVDTRLRKLAEGDLDGIVLARAGLQRLERETAATAILDPVRFVPSPGQGTLALEGRADDATARAAAEAITDERTFACLRAERAVAEALSASCNTPLGAYAVDAGCGCLHLRAWVGLPDGSQWIADELVGGFYDAVELGQRMAERLLEVGAQDLLRSAEEMAIERG